MGAGFFEGGDCFVDFFTADGTGALDAVGGGEFGAGG